MTTFIDNISNSVNSTAPLVSNSSPMDKVILFLLSIVTIREIVKMSGIVPPDKKLSWLIYGKYDNYLIVNALMDLGFSKEKSIDIKLNLKDQIRKITNRTHRLKGNYPAFLVQILSNYIKKFERDILYGDKTKTTSNFYISTMEAVHDKDTLKILVELILNLIFFESNNRNIKMSMPDFVIIPKGGNPILGKEVASTLGILYMLKKSDADKSKAKIDKDMYPSDYLLTNYEGSWGLDDLQKKKHLHGIIIDCNTSGGSQLINTVSEFNDLISRMKMNIEPISKIYTLFRVDRDGTTIDNQFGRENCELKRYFDLDEKLKIKLFSMRQNSDGEKVLNYDNLEDKKKIDDFISEIRSKDYWKLEDSDELE